MKFFLIWLCVMVVVAAAPNYRYKRISENFLADLQARIAMKNKLKGVAITMPVGGGMVDPLKIGRRRRSQTRPLDILINRSDEDKNDEIDYDNLIRNYRFTYE